MKRTVRLSAQPLESRIAPSVTIVNPTTARYADVDGDTVTIKVSKGTLTPGLFTTTAVGSGEQLQAIDLSAGGFDGADLAITAVRGPRGDGFANLGYLNSTNHDLGRVLIKGDLGRIDAGDATTTTTAVKSLVVRSIGRLGIDTQSAGGSTLSTINGPLGSLVVIGDVRDAFLHVAGGADGTIGSMTIGGSLIGGMADNSGKIFAEGGVGPVRIAGDLRGGSGSDAGELLVIGRLHSARIGGSIIGGSNSNTGSIRGLGRVGRLTIGRDLLGGTGIQSGQINIGNDIAGVTVGGSVIGAAGSDSGSIVGSSLSGVVSVARDLTGGSGAGSANIIAITKIASVSIGGQLYGGTSGSSGRVLSGGDLGTVRIGRSLLGGTAFTAGMIESGGNIANVSIGGSLVGGSVTGTDTLYATGVIRAVGRIAKVTIGGSVISGTDDSTGVLSRNAAILAGNDIGSISVAGSLIGNTGPNGDSPVLFIARGQAVPGTTTDLAIGSVTVGGRVENARILAGYQYDGITLNLLAVNGNAQIGSVNVGGDWIAGSVVAGVQNAASGNLSFGDANDAPIAAGGGAITSRISSITIKGMVQGTPSPAGSDHFGFTARQIGSFKAPSFVSRLTGATDAPVELAPVTGDVTVREV